MIYVIPCSAAKSDTDGLLPARDRYTSQFFRMALRWAESQPDCKKIYILSAKYGFITPETSVPFYDEKMTRYKAEYWRGRFPLDLIVFRHCCYKPYQLALPAHGQYLFKNIRGFGDMYTQLKADTKSQ